MRGVERLVMELRVFGRRVRRRGRAVEWEKSYSIKQFSCSATYLACRRPVLNLCLKLCHEDQTMTFKLIHNVRIELLHSTICCENPNPYPYTIRWSLGANLYTLKLSSLEAISSLIALNDIFDIKHIFMQ